MKTKSHLNRTFRRKQAVYCHMQSLNFKRKYMKVEARLFEKKYRISGRGEGQERAIGDDYDQSTLDTYMKMTYQNLFCTINAC
jgi:hypothetical protein